MNTMAFLTELFMDELRAAGITDWRFSFSPNGDSTMFWFAEDYPEAQKQLVLSKAVAHDSESHSFWINEYIKEVKQGCFDYIIKVYPEWKQTNIMRDKLIRPNDEGVNVNWNNMCAYIDEARAVSNTVETSLKQCSTKAELDTVMDTYRSMYGLEIY